MSLSYAEAQRWLLGLHQLGVKFGLHNTRTLCRLLGHPERAYPSVHIAGTNGKGSTAAFLASIARAAGLRVGLTTSPHLVDLRERIQVDGALVSRRVFHEETLRLKETLDTYNAAHPEAPLTPTFFEASIVLAFMVFAREGVNFAVVETGLGGRLDATNVLRPELAVITNIGFDHMDMLGHTLPAIAREKGGIIKTDTPLISAATEGARPVLERIAARCRAPAEFCGDAFSLEERSGRLVYRDADGELDGLTLGLRGAHQRLNAACAIRAARRLAARFPIDEEAIRRGLSAARWPGRLEWRDGTPPWLIDCAHNPHGVETLYRELLPLAQGKRVLFLFAAMKDKDFSGMLARLDSLGPDWIFTRPRLPRAAKADDLIKALPPREGRRVWREPVLTRALARAYALAPDYDLIVMAGSIYFVGAAMPHLRG